MSELIWAGYTCSREVSWFADLKDRNGRWQFRDLCFHGWLSSSVETSFREIHSWKEHNMNPKPSSKRMWISLGSSTLTLSWNSTPKPDHQTAISVTLKASVFKVITMGSHRYIRSYHFVICCYDFLFHTFPHELI